MRKLLIFSILTVLTLTSCKDDSAIFNESAPIRSYGNDVQIMAQFIEVDETSATYVLNPNKKITAIDYIINQGRQNLMQVSQVNRNRFLTEMKDVNNLLDMIKQSESVSSYIYSTDFSNSVVDADNKDEFNISPLTENTFSHRTLGSIKLNEARDNSTSFYTESDIIMTVDAPVNSTFYFAQITISDQDNQNVKTIIISGVKSPLSTHSYYLTTSSMSASYKKVSGTSILGDSNITITFSK